MHLFTLHQLELIFDYLQLTRSYARKTLDNAAVAPDLDREFRAVLIAEWKRREKELSRLIDVTGEEMVTERKRVLGGSEKKCPEERANPDTDPRPKSSASATGKKLSPLEAGTTGTSSSASSAKRRPGRPRKHRPGTSE